MTNRLPRWLLAFCCLAGGASAQDFATETQPVAVATVATGLDHPWGLVFLPDGRMLVSERPGRLRIVAPDGKIGAALANVPKVYDEGQGGLLGLALDPEFAANQRVYFAFAEGDDEAAGTAVGRARLAKGRLEDVAIIFRQQPKVKGKNHWGARLIFDRQGMLFVTMGERFDYRDQAQALDSHLGKLVRIDRDGKAPADNPFVKTPGALPEIWSYGHRNSQGAALHPETGVLWEAEHGPRGGDEVNVITPGENYGWPKASYGSHYTLIPIPDDHKGQGFVEPLYHWMPSISPSGMIFYTGDRFPAWRGNLMTGALNGMCVTRLVLEDGKVVHEERLLQGMEERIRDIAQGPDGLIYLLTDSDQGRILRLEPAKNPARP